MNFCAAHLGQMTYANLVESNLVEQHEKPDAIQSLFASGQRSLPETADGKPYSRSETMPRQRVHHTRITYDFPEDFPRRLELFKDGSGLSWAELARRLGTYPDTVRRWRSGVHPNARHLMALLDLADSFGLRDLFTGQGAVCGNGQIPS